MKSVLCLFVSFLLLFMTACKTENVTIQQGEHWTMGFADSEIPIPTDSEYPLYIAGYHNGKTVKGIYDLQRATAVYMDVNGEGQLLIGIDCIALSSGTCDEIRSKLKDFSDENGVKVINIYATHTHAGVDTLGLWGPVAQSGKNHDFMENLINAAVSAAKDAYQNKTEGRLFYGKTETTGLIKDNRYPQLLDRYLYQLRFEPKNEADSGIRLLFLGVHAESLGGNNYRVSRDFPGMLSDIINKDTGDNIMFLPGAIGGQIVPVEQTDEEGYLPKDNMVLTAKAAAEQVYKITPDMETELTATLSYSKVDITVELDNTLFLYYKFLGILDADVEKGTGSTGYSINTSVSVLCIGEITVALLPGEIFPELVTGANLSTEDPSSLHTIARKHGINELLILGLCNDEIGYIIPPSDYVLDQDLPYFTRPEKDGFGEDHYEETNSAGKNAAFAISEGFDTALSQLKQK